MKKKKKKRKLTKTKKLEKLLLSHQPSNYDFWSYTLANKKSVESFLTRGNERQHTSMVRTLNYLKKYDSEYFEQINGELILKQLKKVKK